MFVMKLNLVVCCPRFTLRVCFNICGSCGCCFCSASHVSGRFRLATLETLLGRVQFCVFLNALIVHSFGSSHLVNVCYNVGCVALLCLLRHLDGL